MLGRENEIELLDSLLRSAAEGRGGGVVVHGEPGIGKTALLEYAKNVEGFRVLRAVGVEPEADLAYATLHQLLMPVLNKTDQLPGPQAQALDILFGRAHGAPPDPFLVGLSTLSLLSLVAGEKPVLCLLDDAHWADQPTLKTLAFVARRLDNEPIALALAARADEGHSTDLPHLRRIPLMGLSAQAAKELLAERSLTDAEWNHLLTSTGGNPLALLELAGREMAPDGEPLAMTDELQRSFLTRIEARHAGSLPLLQLIAADGSGSVETIEKAAAALQIPTNRSALGDLLTYDGAKLVFRHPLIRSAIYHSAADDQRAAIHRALANAFDAPADQHRRAWHLGKAAVGHDEHAAEQLERSAEHAARRGGPAAAMAALTRAAELTADGPRRSRRLWTAALAAIQGGYAAAATDLLDRAESEPDLDEKDQIALAAIRATMAEFAGSPDDAMDLIKPWIPRTLRIDQRLFTPTVVMYADLGIRTNRPHVWADLHEWLDEVPLNEGVLKLLHNTCRTKTGRAPAEIDAPDTVDPVTMTLAGGVARQLGDYELSRRLCRDAGQLARTTGSLGALAWNLEYQATDEIARGRFGLAEAYAQEGCQFALEAGQPNTACRHQGLLALCAAIRSRADAGDLAKAVLAEASGRRLPDAMAYARRALGLLELVAGRHNEAARHFEAIGEPPSDLAMAAFPDLVEALVRAGEQDRAAEAAARFATWTEHTVAPELHALTARCRALVSSNADHYTESLQLHTDSPLESARTELLFGEHLRRERRRSEAQQHLRAAAETFRRIGALSWADRAEGELRATGEAAQAPETGALGTLTPQELRITLAVGEGLTNREIAAQLFLSPRTVDYHLRKVFQKAAITSRAELMRLVLAERPA